MLSAALLGFLLGLRHAFDPDHVIAVSTMVARGGNPWTPAWIGVSWGLGHSAMILGVGFLVVALRIAIPDGVSASLELLVGVMLVLLGLANLAALARGRAAAAAPVQALPLRRVVARSSLVGLAHGLAGSAAVALLATAAMPTPEASLAFLAVFGLGTIAGMVVFTLALGTPVALTGPNSRRRLTACTGLLSLLFGSYLIWAVGSALPGLT